MDVLGALSVNIEGLLSFRSWKPDWVSNRTPVTKLATGAFQFDIDLVKFGYSG